MKKGQINPFRRSSVEKRNGNQRGSRFNLTKIDKKKL